jgi:hypothetical protein
VLLLAAFFVLSFGRSVSAGEMYCVTDEILPVTDSPGLEYKITDGHIDDIESISGIVVYGNHIELKKASNGWMELLSPEDGKSLGYVEEKGVKTLPAYSPKENQYFMATLDAPALFLTPGDDLKLSSWGYELAMGEVIPCVGELRDDSGTLWRLFSFDTDYETGDSGVGARYAWGRDGDFISLADYKPDNSKIKTSLVPSKMRYNMYDGSVNARVDFLNISGDVRNAVASSGFYTDPKPLIKDYIMVDDMAELYTATGEFEVDFITADMLFHSFHLIFENMLKKYEISYLMPALSRSLNRAISDLDALKPAFDGENMSVFETARGILSVARALNEGNSREGLSERALRETSRILSARDVDDSLVTGAKMDYTAFRPRGHYTMTPEYERYFRAMSWLGSAELALFEQEKNPILENIAASMLISLILDAQGEDWKSFREPLDFLIGSPNAGDSGVYSRIARGRGVTPDMPGVRKLLDEHVLRDIASDIASSVKGPMMQSVPGGDAEGDDFSSRAPVFRVLGKRFTYDAYIMNMLTSPRVGTDEHPRNLPGGADVTASLGSGAALELAAKNDGYRNYSENLTKLRGEAKKYLAEDYTVYSKWLASIAAFFESSGSDQFFYNHPSWQWKKLATGSASWAELKHDTILYAEQSGAEMGGGGDWFAGKFAPPLPRGYVEPDPQMFGALYDACLSVLRFIDKFNIESLDSDWDESGRMTCRSQFETLSGILAKMRDIAEKEAKGLPLAPDDYSEIKRTARSFNESLLLPGGIALSGSGKELRMALVADVATDFIDHRVLEAATGTPRRIYVFVNDSSGGARLTRGYVYSYYEFERSLDDERMTDEEWREMVYDPERSEELEKYRAPWL